MVYVRSRKFCCCLPVRFGVFCESILGIALGGFFAVAGWIEIHSLLKGTLDLSHSQKISLWVLAIAMSVFALTSLMGLVGAIGRVRSLVGLYATTITAVTVFNIASGIFFIYNLYHGAGDEQVKKCEANANAVAAQTPNAVGTNVTSWECNTGFAVGRTIVVVVYVIFWLIEIYGCVIAFEYVGQLSEEQNADQEKPTQQNVTVVQPAYTFSASQNAYGRM